jgi:murein DD-endopeptidase MepM/ murein hydrolase activator NlpD
MKKFLQENVGVIVFFIFGLVISPFVSSSNDSNILEKEFPFPSELALNLSDEKNYKCESIFSSYSQGSSFDYAGRHITTSIDEGSEQDYILLNIIGSTILHLNTSFEVNLGNDEGAFFDIISNDDTGLKAIYKSEEIINVFVLNKLDGLGIWTRNGLFFRHDVPYTSTTYVKCKADNLATDSGASVLPNHPESKTSPDEINQAQIPSQLKIDSIQNFTIQPLSPINTDKVVSEVLTKRAPASSGQWGIPTLGVVTQGYSRSHYALDIADTSKPPIWAAADGVVEISKYGWNEGFGNYLVIDHKNGYKTFYAQTETIYVKPGDYVSKGQVIARMGRTGRVRGATGIHLHYECHKDGVRINPYKCMP